MGLLDLLTLPFLGPIKLAYWLGEKTVEQAESEFYDEDKIRSALLELQMSYELGELDEEAYAQQESILLERLNFVREASAE